MEIIITEVTEMHGSVYCVGGWDPNSGCMIRPLPDGSNWQGNLIDAYKIYPGAKIRFKTAGAHASSYPHKTEDHEIASRSIERIENDFTDWLGANAPKQALTLVDAFNGNLEVGKEFEGYYKCYVPIGVNCASLSGVRIDAANFEFFESQFPGDAKKLRARIDDGDERYDLPVTSANIRQTWREGGLGSLHNTYPKDGVLHLRIGLSRTWDKDSDHCWGQLNGVLF